MPLPRPPGQLPLAYQAFATCSTARRDDATARSTPRILVCALEQSDVAEMTPRRTFTRLTSLAIATQEPRLTTSPSLQNSIPPYRSLLVPRRSFSTIPWTPFF